MPEYLETERLQLVLCDAPLCHAILQGDTALNKALDAIAARGWTEFGPAIFEFTLEQVERDPSSAIWWSYLILLKSPRTLIGSCGFKGRPDRFGEVEIGYEIAPDFRNTGYGTETARALIDFAARFPEIRVVKAHTLPFESASTTVLKKCGLTHFQDLFDPDEGEVWQWKRSLVKTEALTY
jgi:ribosomal-protein-alanine N-acetyltransferase